MEKPCNIEGLRWHSGEVKLLVSMGLPPVGGRFRWRSPERFKVALW